MNTICHIALEHGSTAAASFLLNLPNMNTLIRRLHEDAALQKLCGFGEQIPHRTTFNRFRIRVSEHLDLVEASLRKLTNELKADKRLEGLGETVAVDSTTVKTHSNPSRKVVSDGEATWTAKTSDKSKDGKEWYFGFKYHALVDATYGIPLAGITTTASENDTRYLPTLMDKAESLYRWFRPRFVLADRGYDALSNYRDVLKRGAAPIIAIRNTSRKELVEGLYTRHGEPVCMGMVPMDYVRTDSTRGHLYRCRPQGCRLKSRKGVRYCDDTEWVRRPDNPRVFGPIRRTSKEWRTLYNLRQTIEGTFKSLKQSRRLESHCLRGLRNIKLHVTMSALALQATIWLRLKQGRLDLLRWMVRRVP